MVYQNHWALNLSSHLIFSFVPCLALPAAGSLLERPLFFLAAHLVLIIFLPYVLLSKFILSYPGPAVKLVACGPAKLNARRTYNKVHAGPPDQLSRNPASQLQLLHLAGPVITTDPRSGG